MVTQKKANVSFLDILKGKKISELLGEKTYK